MNNADRLRRSILSRWTRGPVAEMMRRADAVFSKKERHEAMTHLHIVSIDPVTHRWTVQLGVTPDQMFGERMTQTQELAALEEVVAAWQQDRQDWLDEFGAALPYPRSDSLFDLEDALVARSER